MAIGSNAVGSTPNTHGTTGHLTPQQVDDVVAFVLSIE